MKLGLKRGTVELCDHDAAWEENARETIALLKDIFGGAAIDIQHIGSTAIRAIKAKPIIDIAVGIAAFDVPEHIMRELNRNGIIHRPH
ncbi:MAG: GrpB family protein, partial [Clostridiales Family XIII bacterium]|nr:GrpB family protein [Clostridiales Family XIII bacterium]